MVKLPAGAFVMGSTPDEVLAAQALCARELAGHRCTEQTFANELGRRLQNLPAFLIDRTEVTVEAYARCVAVGQCEAAGYRRGATRFDRPGLPVTFVNHDDARAYCRFRGARLPSEAEYERAARGLSGRSYPWGELYNSHVSNHGRLGLLANDPSDGFAELAPVGSFPAGRTPEGVLDLAGNVAEWVADVYVERYGDTRPSTGGDERVVRGGSFESAAPFLRAAARRGVSKDTVSPTIGFRCARSLDPALPVPSASAPTPATAPLAKPSPSPPPSPSPSSTAPPLPAPTGKPAPSAKPSLPPSVRPATGSPR
jgi:formylglycine-generating enzyme required for sulfatase activity